MMKYLWTLSFCITTLLSTNGNAAEYFEIGRPVYWLSDDGQAFAAGDADGESIVWTRDGGFLTAGAFPDTPLYGTIDGQLRAGPRFVWESHGSPLPAGFVRLDANQATPDGRRFIGTAWGEIPTNGFAEREAVLWSVDQGFTRLGVPVGYDHSDGVDISADGGTVLVTGLWLDEVSYGGWERFLWDEGNGLQSLSELPETIGGRPLLGTTTGRYDHLSADGRSVTLRAHTNTENGDCCSDHALIWSEAGGYRVVPQLADPILGESYRMSPFKLTEDGTALIGTTSFSDGTWRVFVWDERNGTRDLRQVLIDEHSFSISELPELPFAFGMSSSGMLLGGWTDSRQDESWIVVLDKPLISPAGDFNGDHYRDAADMDILSQAIQNNVADDTFDLNADSLLDASDRDYWVSQLENTFFGDANLDGEFNSSDLVAVFEAGRYEDAIEGNSGWTTGDWNGDTEFNTSDLVLAFQDGGYEQGPRAAIVAVPEPTSAWPLLTGPMLLMRRQKSQL